MKEWVCREISTTTRDAENGILMMETELIRCKDCKHHHYENNRIPYCNLIDYGYGWEDNDVCSRAERRNNVTVD